MSRGDVRGLAIRRPTLRSDDKPTIRVAGLLVHEGRILMVEQGRGDERYWLLPGGGVQFGETLSDALRREFHEELGLRVGVAAPARDRRVDLAGSGLRQARGAPGLRGLGADGGRCRSRRTSRSSRRAFLERVPAAVRRRAPADHRVPAAPA